MNLRGKIEQASTLLGDRKLKLLPPVTPEQVDRMRLANVFPQDEAILELLHRCSGFQATKVGTIDLTGSLPFELELFPACVPLTQDDAGNPWVVDVSLDERTWGPVFFVSHDPPVVVLHSPNIAVFLEEVVDLVRNEIPLEGVCERAVRKIWKEDSWLIDARVVKDSRDLQLARFAEEMPSGFKVADLRSKQIGSGFSWGKAGPNAQLKRMDGALVFGVEARKKTLLARFLSR